MAHSQRKLPGMLTHSACRWHSVSPLLHSSMSAGTEGTGTRDGTRNAGINPAGAVPGMAEAALGSLHPVGPARLGKDHRDHCVQLPVLCRISQKSRPVELLAAPGAVSWGQEVLEFPLGCGTFADEQDVVVAEADGALAAEAPNLVDADAVGADRRDLAALVDICTQSNISILPQHPGNAPQHQHPAPASQECWENSSPTSSVPGTAKPLFLALTLNSLREGKGRSSQAATEGSRGWEQPRPHGDAGFTHQWASLCGCR